MDAAHFREQRRKDVEADGHASHEANGAFEGLARVADSGDGVVQVLKHPMAQLQERFARRRNADASSDAMEDRLAEFVLEQQDLAADGGLRDVQLFARGGERAGVGDRADDLELPEVHAVSIHSRRAWVQWYRCPWPMIAPTRAYRARARLTGAGSASRVRSMACCR